MILCIDCGLTNGKLLLFSNDGCVLAETSFPTPLSHALIDTHALRSNLYRGISEIVQHSGINPESISCISVSGHGNGLYLLGEKDVLPIGYSSMFTDSEDSLPKLGLSFPIIFQSDWAGQPLPILSWIKRTQPNVYSQIKTVFFCKDLLRWFLTDVAVTEETDASAAGLLNAHNGKYDINLLRLYDLEDFFHKLPVVLKSNDYAGFVTETAAQKTGLLAGTPVLAGLFDVNSCMLGSGVIDTGRYSLIAGTWGINAAVSNTLVENKAITQCCRFFGNTPYVCIDSAPTSCSNLEWFVHNILNDMPYDQVNRLVQQAPMDDNLFYLPYLYAPMDMPTTKGGFVGLKPHHNVASMLRAIYEGIAFEHRYRLEKLQRSDLDYSAAVLSGGASKSLIFAQTFANICGLDMQVPKQTQAGALGGAILGLCATGVYPSLDAATEKLIQIQDTYSPNLRYRGFYNKKYNQFRSILKRMQGGV